MFGEAAKAAAAADPFGLSPEAVHVAGLGEMGRKLLQTWWLHSEKGELPTRCEVQASSRGCRGDWNAPLELQLRVLKLAARCVCADLGNTTCRGDDDGGPPRVASADRVIYFREGGVPGVDNPSLLTTFIMKEREQLEDAFRALTPGYEPEILMVSADRSHLTRLLPASVSDAPAGGNGNVPSVPPLAARRAQLGSHLPFFATSSRSCDNGQVC